MNGRVVIERRGDRLYVTGACLTKGGHRMNDILHVLPAGVSPLTLGEVVLETWRDSTVVSMEDPVPDNPALDALLKQAGVRTYAQYVRGTRHVQFGPWWGLGQNVYQPRGPLHVTPCENRGPGEGFATIDDAVIELDVDEATPQRVGESVLAALEIAR